MDDDLAQRYLALFLAYNVGGRGDLEALKAKDPSVNAGFFASRRSVAVVVALRPDDLPTFYWANSVANTRVDEDPTNTA